MGRTEGLLDTTAERFDPSVRTNIWSSFRITGAAVPHMEPDASVIDATRAQGHGPTPTMFDRAVTMAADAARRPMAAARAA